MRKGVSMANRIALVDDDQNIIASVSVMLEQEGYEVDCYFDGEQALFGILKRPVDMGILDIKMPRMDGVELLQKLRQKTDMPVIFLTSKDEEIDEALGLRMGADDYITKPFSQKLLIERIRAVLRRSSLSTSTDPEKIIQRGDLMLDIDRHISSWKNVDVRLTVTEFLILQSLVSRPGLVKSRDQLMDVAYGETIYVDDRTIDSHIKRMRRKFKHSDKEFDKIETLYGIGYRYRDNK